METLTLATRKNTIDPILRKKVDSIIRCSNGLIRSKRSGLRNQAIDDFELLVDAVKQLDENGKLIPGEKSRLEKILKFISENEHKLLACKRIVGKDRPGKVGWDYAVYNDENAVYKTNYPVNTHQEFKDIHDAYKTGLIEQKYASNNSFIYRAGYSEKEDYTKMVFAVRRRSGTSGTRVCATICLIFAGNVKSELPIPKT